MKRDELPIFCKQDSVVIGCDPDSKGNGIAVFLNKKLCYLGNLTAIDFYLKFMHLKEIGCSVTLATEDVMKNKATFSRKGASNEGQRKSIAMKVGRCQQAQVEIEAAASVMGFDVVKMPLSSQWKKGDLAVASFKRCTEWEKSGNEDTRSAAWMGYDFINR